MLLHRLFEAHPAVIIAVLIGFCDEQGFLIAAGIEVFPDLITAGVIVYTNILEGVGSLGVGIDQDHFFVQLAGKPAVLFFVVPEDDKPLDIPFGSDVHYILDIFAADEHDVVAFFFCFHLDGSDQLAHERVLKGLHAVSIVKAKYYAYDPGTMTGKHHGAHVGNVVPLFEDCRDLINGCLGNPLGIAIYDI